MMYYLLLLLLYPVSLLPLWVLYRLSDLAFVIIYYGMGYRRAIVLDNLRHAFPEKSEKELNEISQKTYRHFCDQWIETLKLLSISPKALNRRVEANWEVFHRLYREGKNSYSLLGHTYNWEWANVACGWKVSQQVAAIYLPLSSTPFDRLMLRLRSRSGSLLISMKSLKRGLAQLSKDRPYTVAQIADQNPSVTEVATWLPFMNRETPFFRGAEQLARRSRAAVLFCSIKRKKRGYYQIHLHCICEDASQEEQGSVLERYVQLLEQQIREQPENWMWTHRRWKHARKQ